MGYIKKGQNYSADKKQFEEYRKVLGNKIPGRFADFQDLKYNKPDEWSKLKTLKKQTVFVKNADCETTPKKFTGYFSSRRQSTQKIFSMSGTRVIIQCSFAMIWPDNLT